MEARSSKQTAADPSGGPVPSARTRLENDSVHIWSISIPQTLQENAGMKACLAADEIDRLERFYYPADRNRFLIAHWSLRVILGHYLGLIPGEVQFATLRNGKPTLAAAAGLYFNLAHSGGIALAAVTRAGEIGVDVEKVRQVQDLENLARTCFSPGEYRRFRQIPEPVHHEVFFTTWARKEAFIKATGEGLFYPLDQFEVSLDPAEPARLLSIGGSRSQAQDWTLRDIPVEDGYAAAFALQAPSIRTSQVRFSDWWRYHEQSITF